ncbi:MAG: peroxiredoxin, partial [Nitrospirota bacterium]|nr:peroxiredoxin [Nitrospirota bacterium]
YPKDDTPGCTKESCAFRDGLDEILENGAIVVGVSPDSVASHKKFAKKFDLNFPLLSDESKSMLEAYGVWKQKSMYGRSYMGVERTTFIISPDGKIDEIFSKVKVDNHLEEVLGELDVMP